MTMFPQFLRSALTILVMSASLSVAAELTKDSLDVVKKNLKDKKAVLVDVREKSEWDEGHIEDAVFLPLSELRADPDAKQLEKKLPKNKIVYTHCVVGKRSVTAGDILEKRGFEVRPLKAGYKELLESGMKKAKD